MNYFSQPYFKQPFFKQDFFTKNSFFKLPFFTGIGGGAGSGSGTGTPTKPNTGTGTPTIPTKPNTGTGTGSGGTTTKPPVKPTVPDLSKETITGITTGGYTSRGHLHISWDPAANVDSYHVLVYDENDKQVGHEHIVSLNRIILTGLTTPDTDYTIKIKGCNTGGCTPFAITDYVTPEAKTNPGSGTTTPGTGTGSTTPGTGTGTPGTGTGTGSTTPGSGTTTPPTGGSDTPPTGAFTVDDSIHGLEGFHHSGFTGFTAFDLSWDAYDPSSGLDKFPNKWHVLGQLAIRELSAPTVWAVLNDTQSMDMISIASTLKHSTTVAWKENSRYEVWGRWATKHEYVNQGQDLIAGKWVKYGVIETKTKANKPTFTAA